MIAHAQVHEDVYEPGHDTYMHLYMYHFMDMDMDMNKYKKMKIISSFCF
jgi:hypothetical protein